MPSFIPLAAAGFATVLIAFASLWAGLALWFRFPGGSVAAGLAVTIWAALVAASLYGLWNGRWLPFWFHAIAWIAIAAWFAWIPARGDRPWAPDVARMLTATIEGDRLTVPDVRNFDWRSETEAEPRWERRSYDLAKLETLDLFNVYWTGPAIAHSLVSFGFGEGIYLTISVEIRREAGAAYSNTAGFFKEYELAFVGADERDIIRLRTNYRNEDVRLFRIKLPPEQIRAFLLDILQRANAVAARPAFYNSLTRNCTTELFGAARTVAPSLPLDWRIILSGYLPDYLERLELLDASSPLEKLRQKASVNARAQESGTYADFSRNIREGVPDPNR